jgi:hypothetical protein
MTSNPIQRGNQPLEKMFAFLFVLAGLLSACQGSAATGTAPVTGSAANVTSESFAGTQASPEQPSGTTTTSGSIAPQPAANCTVVSTVPTPGPTEQSLFPPVGEGDWVQGPATADVTIIEYSDFM